MFLVVPSGRETDFNRESMRFRNSMDCCISFFMNMAHRPSPLIPLPVLCTGFAFTGAGRGQGEGCMNFGKD